MTENNTENLIKSAILQVFESSDSSESDDDSDYEDMENLIKALIRVVKDTPVRSGKKLHKNGRLNALEFKSTYRLLPSTFEYVLGLIGESVAQQNTEEQTLSPRKQLLMSLWMLSSSESYKATCIRFSKNLPEVLAMSHAVFSSLCKFADQYIRWPTGARATECMEGYQKLCGLTLALGALDNTHIHIQMPNSNPVMYMNDVGDFSVQLQVICDHKKRFIHCYTGLPGSVHDQHVLNSSEIGSLLAKPEKFFPGRSYLIGDEAYSITPNLMVPYTCPKRQKEFIFNSRMDSGHRTVSNALGMLRNRFPRVNKFPISKVDAVASCVFAACILHNICLARKDLMPQFDTKEDDCDACDFALPNVKNEYFKVGCNRRTEITLNLTV